MVEFITRLDTVLFLFFNHAIANPVFDLIFPILTNGVFWIVPGALAALLFIKIEKRKAIGILCLSLLTVSVSDPVCNRIIKPAVHRLRPCDPRVHMETGRFLLGRKTSLSFPSSHAMNMFAQAMLLTLFYRRKAVWFFTFAAVIGFSRVYTGVHYPFDVLGGAFFGVLTGALAFGCHRMTDAMIKKRKLRAKPA
jgi:undecaprenyl-diphosphatase